MASTGTDFSCECKIGRKQKKYQLHAINEKLIHERKEERASLRDLARTVNIEIIHSILSEVGADFVGDANSIYDVITQQDVPADRQVMVTDQLQTHGINMNDLRDDFVSYQSVRHHFRKCLEISTERRGIESVSEAKEIIEWSRERHENIVTRTLARLDRIGTIQLKEPVISSSLTITCEDCDAIFRVDELLSQEACDC